MKVSKNKFFCFSPPVMLATFTIEIILFCYVLIRYKMSPLTRIVGLLLILLALFQLAEYKVCGSTGMLASTWSRIGYMSITMLPPLGIHLIYRISKRKERVLVWTAYLSGTTFAVVLGLSKTAFGGHVCLGNYAIFQLNDEVGGIYFAYYYFWLFIGTALSLILSYKASNKIREALILQVFGYLSFLLPTGIVNTINPRSINGIPSIMCGFAVIYAFILVFGIVPVVVPKNSNVLTLGPKPQVR